MLHTLRGVVLALIGVLAVTAAARAQIERVLVIGSGHEIGSPQYPASALQLAARWLLVQLEQGDQSRRAPGGPGPGQGPGGPGPGPGQGPGGPGPGPGQGPGGPGPGPGQAPAFGTPNAVFVVGQWRIVKSAGEFYFWTDNGNKAIQVTLDSNGWWGVRRFSDEKVVWSSGSTGEGSFYERPWQRFGGPTYTLSTITYEGRGSHGATSIRVGGNQIRITLTDRGEIELNTQAPAIVFRSSRGGTFTF